MYKQGFILVLYAVIFSQVIRVRFVQNLCLKVVLCYWLIS